MNDKYGKLVPALAAVAAKLREQRGGQYNRSGVDIRDYFMGLEGHMQMVHVKALRLRSFMGQVQGRLEDEIEDASPYDMAKPVGGLVDSAVDLINYALYMAAEAMCMVHEMDPEERSPLETVWDLVALSGQCSAMTKGMIDPPKPSDDEEEEETE